jgi:sugar (pentulose or hexulose) kinase
MMSGFLGIDVGTQGLSVLFTDERLKVVAVADAPYSMVPGLSAGHYEQRPEDWITALRAAMQSLRNTLDTPIDVMCIGVAGQMHGEVLIDEAGQPLESARLWCDGRNDDEGHALTTRFGVKIPRRMTAARWLWTVKNQPHRAAPADRLTTPAGWIAWTLTGTFTLGIGDASGVFPINPRTLSYDETLLDSFDEQARQHTDLPLRNMLPRIARAGQDGGVLNERGAALLGLDAGIPVAPAEGDQPAAMAGSNIATAGTVSASFGTSVCANLVADRPFNGVHSAVDHFCAVDGAPIHMICLNNGTTFLNTLVNLFGQADGVDHDKAFQDLMPMLLSADPSCGGVLAFPFIDDEPALDNARGSRIEGLTSTNATPGNILRAAIQSTMFNLKLGLRILGQQGLERTTIVLTGGLARTPAMGQILADVMNTPVRVLQGAYEGSALGAAMLAQYRHNVITGDHGSWSSHVSDAQSDVHFAFEPRTAGVNGCAAAFEQYEKRLNAR